MELININEFKKKSTRRYVLHIVLVSLLLAGTIAGCILSLLFSKLDYTVNLIINLSVSIVVAVLVIFYFVNIFPIIHHYYSFAKNLNEVGLEHRRRREFEKELDVKTINNVNYRVMLFSYKEGENTYKENLYVLDNDVVFEKGKAYKITSYRNVIIRFEDLSDANN